MSNSEEIKAGDYVQFAEPVKVDSMGTFDTVWVKDAALCEATCIPAELLVKVDPPFEPGWYYRRHCSPSDGEYMYVVTWFDRTPQPHSGYTPGLPPEPNE